MDETFRIRRHAGALFVPGGTLTVATLLALSLAAVALLVPIAWLERIAAQIGLVRWMPDAVPPFDLTERLVFALALAPLGALLGWALARAFRVADDGEGWTRLLERVRGVSVTADEADAPRINRADRHPDAPARRPLSPLRDLVPPRDADAFDADELLLDTPADVEAAELAVLEATTLPAPSLSDWEAEVQPPPPEPALPQEAVEVDDAPCNASAIEELGELEPTPIPPVNADEAFAADADDVPLEVASAAPPLSETELVRTPPPPPAFTREPRSAPPPIDLSVERLDALVARLERGAARRESALASDASTPDPASNDPEEAALLNDPALAAALRTLRRMNAAA